MTQTIAGSSARRSGKVFPDAAPFRTSTRTAGAGPGPLAGRLNTTDF
jgi:hypothetical protein